MNDFLKKLIKGRDPRKAFFKTLSQSKTVLDLGCGTGDNGTALRAMHGNIEVHGVDILSEASVPDFYIYKCLDLDQNELPYPDKYFDAVVFTHVIEHLQSPFRLGKELNRVMKKGAKIYIEAPNWTTLFVPSFGFHREQHNPFNFYDDPTHVKPWSKHGLFEFLEQGCNCQVIGLGNTRSWWEVPFDLLIIPIAMLIQKRPWVVSSFWNLYGWCIYAVGSKEKETTD